MLDRPNALGTDPNSQLESYLLEAETIRRFVRNAETNNMATLDEAKQMLKDIEPREAKPAPSPKKPKTSKKR
jgi:hypothetical protein